MNLPEGVQHTPGRLERLIKFSTERGDALISIDPSLGYKTVKREFKQAFQDLYSEDYRAFAQRYHLMSRFPVYSGAEHKGDPKLPNITVVPNVATRLAQTVSLQFDQKTFNIGRTLDFRMPASLEVTLFGCTMGHWHGQADCPDEVQEIYEFQSYGALLIDRPQSDELELWVARSGDKIAVPQQCHMTLYNLDDGHHPLITLDFANPERNYANKELVKRIGPILLAYYTTHEAVFILNHRYINRERVVYEDLSPPPTGVENRQCLNGGVRLPTPIIGQEGREVRTPLGTRASLGEQLYEALTGDAEVIIKFARLGVCVRPASPEVQLGGIWYGRPLAEAVAARLGKASQLRRFFFSHSGKSAEESSENEAKILEHKRPLHKGEEQWLRKGPRFLEPGREEGEQVQRDIQILIEGAGDWVDKGIIASIEKAREELAVRRSKGQTNLPDFRVIIADDSRWHSPGKKPPVKPNPQIYPDLRRAIDQGLNQGKSYGIAPRGIAVPPRPVGFLDKADPSHLWQYQRLRPGVVFIVTPDYTHSTLCRAHLDRALTIFVEKPFDANWENVRALLEARGRAALDTEIYALDHYRFYAWHLRELLPEATSWLGGALREARFCMTETGPVEPHRIRTLQYGMLLDMLPHGLAMLAFFGELDSLDEFEVREAGRYEGAPIPSETYAHVQLTFEDYSDNGWRVPCRAWVGKGLRAGRKYLEVVGQNGRSVLVALGKTSWRHEGRDWDVEGGIYFVDEQGQFVDSQGQPTEKPRAPLDKDRYKQLLLDLMAGERKAIRCAMPLVAGEQIVHALDRFWNAVQAHSPWEPYALGELDCGGL